MKALPFRLYNNPATAVICIEPVETVQLVFVTVMDGTAGEPGGVLIVAVPGRELHPELFCAITL